LLDPAARDANMHDQRRKRAQLDHHSGIISLNLLTHEKEANPLFLHSMPKKILHIC
jgi:hypothetical protein